ncbi:TIGR00725 family protein [Castellaniella sp. S9]|uniref:TIGR00725 family protein n=1 Tax=Castellaniella sp. S9 TaxID=2993652 RepID=UPI0022B593F4|nr:TIGR00725 family protein [Castellaniella sp. S9]
MSTPSFSWSQQAGALYAGAALRFDPWAWQWSPAGEGAPADLRAVDACEALRRLAGTARLVPVAVIGPREASDWEYRTAEALGAALARHGLQLLCGGRNGVMEASAKGHLEAGGQPIGLLPDNDWRSANPYVRIPIATGIGKSRNAIIAQSCPVLIAVGGGYGTMSEIAFGLHFDHMVLSLGEAPKMPGVIACVSVDEALRRTAEHLLRTGPGVGAALS